MIAERTKYLIKAVSEKTATNAEMTEFTRILGEKLKVKDSDRIKASKIVKRKFKKKFGIMEWVVIGIGVIFIVALLVELL